LALMAGEAHSRLSATVENRIVAHVNGMATRAPNLVEGVRACVPCRAGVAGMATEADGVLLVDGRTAIGSECTDRRLRLATPHTLRMRGTGTVTAFALQLRERGVRIVPATVRRCEDRHRRRIVARIVAAEAGIGPALAQARFDLGRRRLRVHTAHAYRNDKRHEQQARRPTQ
jgi:hypothetical protein